MRARTHHHTATAIARNTLGAWFAVRLERAAILGLFGAMTLSSACGADDVARSQDVLEGSNGAGKSDLAAGAGGTASDGVAGFGGSDSAGDSEGADTWGVAGAPGTTGAGTDGATAGNDEDTRDAEARPTCSGKPGLPGMSPRELMVGGVSRKYLLYIPASVEPNQGAPVVFVHHGMTMTGDAIRTATGYDALADEKGFVVAFPDGVGTSWSTGPLAAGWGGLAGSTADDFGFVEAMLDDIEDQQCIDRTRVFTTGLSMGGYFSNHIGCARPDLVRAIAPHSGGREVETSCVAGPKPVMILHGTLDLLITYAECGEAARKCCRAGWLMVLRSGWSMASLSEGLGRRGEGAVACAVAGVVECGVTVAEDQALEIAHGDGELVGDPGDRWQADQGVAVGDLAVLGDDGEDGLVEGGVQDAEDGEFGRLIEVVGRGAHQAAPATVA